MLRFPNKNNEDDIFRLLNHLVKRFLLTTQYIVMTHRLTIHFLFCFRIIEKYLCAFDCGNECTKIK